MDELADRLTEVDTFLGGLIERLKSNIDVQKKIDHSSGEMLTLRGEIKKITKEYQSLKVEHGQCERQLFEIHSSHESLIRKKNNEYKRDKESDQETLTVLGDEVRNLDNKNISLESVTENQGGEIMRLAEENVNLKEENKIFKTLNDKLIKTSDFTLSQLYILREKLSTCERTKDIRIEDLRIQGQILDGVTEAWQANKETVALARQKIDTVEIEKKNLKENSTSGIDRKYRRPKK